MVRTTSIQQQSHSKTRVMKNIILFAFCAFALSQSASAQKKNNDKVYTTFGGNGGILSFSDVKDNGTKVNSIPRFTFFFNIGTNYNYDVSDHFGVFSGTNIKNIGMITEVGDTKLKRRVYTLGVPVGFKVGNIKEGVLLFGGAEVDLAFNYKEKTFVNDDKKDKFNEWFSSRTQTLMPSVFAGFQFSEHFSIKGQYYLNNFFNQDYTSNGMKPYQNLDAKLFFVTLGYNFSRKDFAKK